MGIYIFTFIILLAFAFLELRTNLNTAQHKSMLVLVYVLFVFQAGFRWHTGTDWEPYIINFENTNSIADVYYSLDNFERGYGFFVYVIKSIWNNYTVFLVISALVYYLLVFFAFQKLSPYVFVSLLVFYAINMGVLGSNRQLIALGICLFAMRYVLHKNAAKFFLLVGLAFLFHRSAILFSLYFFINRDLKQSWIYTILILSFILGKTSIPILLFSFVGDRLGVVGSYKVMVYLSESKNDLQALSILGLLKRIFFIGLFIYNYKILTTKLTYYRLIFNGYFVGLVIYFLFSSSILVVVNRGSLYFTTMEALLLSSQFILIKNKDYKVSLLFLLFILSILFFFQSIGAYADLFVPYKGIFINSEFMRYRLQ